MARVHRVDHLGSLAAPIRRADGTMIAEARMTRTGVFTYRKADGTTRREYRSPDEVFRADSLASFRGVPVTNKHPPEMITAQNARKYTVGAVLDTPRRDGDYAVATIAVHDAATIAAMDAGKNQVSNGYDVDLIEEPGTSPDGERYDARQTNIVGNHFAIGLDNARAGSDAIVRMDDAAWMDDDLSAADRHALGAREFAYPEAEALPIENEAHLRDAMSRFGQTDFSAHPGAKSRAYHRIIAKAKALGVDATGFANEWANRLDDLYERVDAMDKDEQIRALKLRCDENDKTLTERKDALDAAARERDELKARCDSLTEQVAALNTKLAAGATAMETEAIAKHAKRADDAEAKLTALEQKRPDDIRRAAELRLKAQAVMGSDFRCDGMPDRAVQCAVIRKLAPKDDVRDVSAGGPSDAYVSTRCDSLVEAFVANARSLTRASEVITRVGVKNTATLDTPEARAKAWHDHGTLSGYRPHGQNEE